MDPGKPPSATLLMPSAMTASCHPPQYPLLSLATSWYFYCPRNPEYWRVVIGLHHLYKWQSHTENHRVKDIVVHSEFKSGHYENDIALFKLIRSVKYSEYIQPICLPDIVLLMSDDNPCYISGWERSKTKGKSLNRFI
uniref:Peptidase S1 domain-containing protein n=1 Tax=Salvator merianae TaxID=96440 RepID=A0A8D0DMZ7_SALMN